MSKFITVTLLLVMFAFVNTNAQTLTDGIYMPKKNFCNGFLYSHDSWKEYWEGTLKRENLNIGTLSTQSIAYMAMYGITDRLNIGLGLPYVWTKASAGTLSGLSGIQDLSFGLKYNIYTAKILKGDMSFNIAAGGSIPVTNYVADFLPVAIGLQSKTAFGRGIIHFFTPGNLSVTAQASYIGRANIKIDRTSYYTDHLIVSNEVAMPDVFNYSLKAGYYSWRWAAEAFFDNTDCLGGFDIRRNDMPFPSNEMDMTRVGIMGHYRIEALDDLQIVASAAYTVAGRNVGQSTTISFGLMKIFNFNKDKN